RHRGTQSDVIEGVCDDREEAHATAEIDRGCGGIGGTGGGKQGQARTEGEGSLRHVGADTTNADQRVVDPRAAPAVVRGRLPKTSARKRPVCESGLAATSSGVPTATTFPPWSPPSGPRSTIQSAVLITSRLCSITRTVLPAETRRCSTWSSLRMSSKCSPVVGSSKTYSVLPVARLWSSDASLMRCASPPESVGAGCP